MINSVIHIYVFECPYCLFDTDDEQDYNSHMLDHQEAEEDEFDTMAELRDEMRMEDR